MVTAVTKGTGKAGTATTTSDPGTNQRVELHRDDIVVRQCGLRLRRGLGGQRVLHNLLGQPELVGDLAGNALVAAPGSRLGKYALRDHFSGVGQQFSITPDMLVPLLFRQIERVKVLGDLNQLGLKRVNGA